MSDTKAKEEKCCESEKPKEQACCSTTCCDSNFISNFLRHIASFFDKKE